jgi:heptosyltransferase-3
MVISILGNTFQEFKAQMNILFITCSRIGDAVLTTGVLNYIAEKHRNAQVTIAADPLVADLFQDYPLLKTIIRFAKEKNSKHWFTLWKQVVGQRWDWIIDLRGSGIAYALFAQKRTTWKSVPKDTRHKVEQISACVHIPVTAPHLWIGENTYQSVEGWVPSKPFLALAPAANWVGKQWPLDSFSVLLSLFNKSFPNAPVIIMAAPHERSMIQPLLDKFSNCSTIIDYNPSLIQTAACIQKARVFLGNDSGLMHMAAALKTPTVGLFGPSREENYGPFQYSGEDRNSVVRIPMTYDQLAQTEGFSHKSQNCYMTDLTVETVWSVLEYMWQKNGG